LKLQHVIICNVTEIQEGDSTSTWIIFRLQKWIIWM